LLEVVPPHPARQAEEHRLLGALLGRGRQALGAQRLGRVRHLDRRLVVEHQGVEARHLPGGGPVGQRGEVAAHGLEALALLAAQPVLSPAQQRQQVPEGRRTASNGAFGAVLLDLVLEELERDALQAREHPASISSSAARRHPRRSGYVNRANTAALRATTSSTSASLITSGGR